MKKLKRLSVIITAMVLTTMSFSNVFAAEKSSSEKHGGVTVYNNNSDPQTPIDGSYEEPTNRVFVTEDFAKSQENNTVTPLSLNGTITPHYGESEVSHVKKTEYYTKTTTPDGQPAGGVRFGSGGGFYVNLDGGVDLSFSVGTSWGPVDYSISVGYASTGNIGGYFVQVPDTTHYWKAKIDHTMRYRHVLVDVYQYGTYEYSYWTTWTDDFSDYCYCVRA